MNKKNDDELSEERQEADSSPCLEFISDLTAATFRVGFCCVVFWFFIFSFGVMLGSIIWTENGLKFKAQAI